MATIEELISALLPLLPEAEVRIDASGEVVIHTGLTAPAKPARPHHAHRAKFTSSRESRIPAASVDSPRTPGS
jgi:hypothetical protein